MKLILFTALLIVGVRSIELPKNIEKDEVVVDKAGDLTEEDMTKIPPYLAQGMRGSGDWLQGIADRVDLLLDKATDDRRKELLEHFNEGVLGNSDDATLKFPELARKYGYPVEEYDVKTDDGYILKLFRIPYGKNSPVVAGVKRPVIFLMHGLMDSADDWILMGPTKSLGYLMADAGYDVWLGNARGNTYSKKHVSLLPNNIEFWDFSWEEIGRFDLPAMIDFALKTTAETKLYYVGHSQGTTSFFVMCSMRPEYNAKIRIMYALAPIAWMSNMVSPLIRLLSPQTKEIEWVTDAMGVGEFMPNSRLLAVAGGIVCKDKAITQVICTDSVFLVCGFDLDQMNTTMLPVIMGHSPAGSSVKQFLHYGQGVVSKDFRRYDHGYIKNIMDYGRFVPPSYDMSKVTAPVALFYSTNDWLSHPTDVTILSKKLGKMVDMYLVPNSRFNHMDYMWAIDAPTVVFKRIFDTIGKY